MSGTRGFILAPLLAMVTVLTSSSMVLSAPAQDQGTAPDPQLPPREPPWMSQLTDDQKEQFQQLTQSMKDSGATQEEIRDAVDAKLQEWGIELPAPPRGSGQ
jgi:hypothetical protein